MCTSAQRHCPDLLAATTGAPTIAIVDAGQFASAFFANPSYESMPDGRKATLRIINAYELHLPRRRRVVATNGPAYLPSPSSSTTDHVSPSPPTLLMSTRMKAVGINAMRGFDTPDANVSRTGTLAGRTLIVTVHLAYFQAEGCRREWRFSRADVVQ